MKNWYKFAGPLLGLSVFFAGWAAEYFQNQDNKASLSDRMLAQAPVGWSATPVSMIKDTGALSAFRVAATRTFDKSSTLQWAYDLKDFCEEFADRRDDTAVFQVAASNPSEAAGIWYKIHPNTKISSSSELCRKANTLTEDKLVIYAIINSRTLYDDLRKAGISPIAVAAVPNRLILDR
jgi:hypothetical protein